MTDASGLRVIIAGGGTGGHLFPGLAVAQALRQRKENTVLFVGTEKGLEREIVPRAGFSLRTIAVEGLRGRPVKELFPALVSLWHSLSRSADIVREFHPHLIVGVGGYAAGPVVTAGWRAGLPCLLLEQNVKPGLTNRLLGKIVNTVCVNFVEAAAYFPREKVVHTGTPLRWTSVPAGLPAERPCTVLIFGGSAGAHRLNVVVPPAMRRLADTIRPLHIIHQTGKQDYAEVRETYARLGLAAEITPFIDDMADGYSRAHLVVCRAGATTLAELTLWGKPAVLIPYPYAADDHQRANAEVLARRGAALIMLDRDLRADALTDTLQRLLTDRQELQAMSQRALALGRPQATAAVVRECCKLLQGSEGACQRRGRDGGGERS